MKKTIFVFLLGLLAFYPDNRAASANAIPIQSVFSMSAADILSFDNATIEQHVGRKLKFKEKIALKFVKKKLKKNKALTPEAALNDLKTDGMATAGFICGLVSVFIFGILLGTLGIIFSAIALGRIRRNSDTKKGRGLAIAGLVLGIVGFFAWSIVLVAALSA